MTTRIKMEPSKINRYQIAKETGINLAHVSRIFSGKAYPSFHAAAKIADAMGWTLDELANQLSIRERFDTVDELESV